MSYAHGAIILFVSRHSSKQTSWTSTTGTNAQQHCRAIERGEGSPSGHTIDGRTDQVVGEIDWKNVSWSEYDACSRRKHTWDIMITKTEVCGEGLLTRWEIG